MSDISLITDPRDKRSVEGEYTWCTFDNKSPLPTHAITVYAFSYWPYSEKGNSKIKFIINDKKENGISKQPFISFLLVSKYAADVNRHAHFFVAEKI